jgi:hypothetical protein
MAVRVGVTAVPIRVRRGVDANAIRLFDPFSLALNIDGCGASILRVNDDFVGLQPFDRRR